MWSPSNGSRPTLRRRGRLLRTLTPLFHQQSPPLVIPPATTDVEIARRVPLAAKAQALHQTDRRAIMRLDVGFDAVQAQTTKHQRQRQRQGLAHVAAPRKRGTDVVPEICAPESPPNDLAQLNSSDDRTISA